MLSHRVPSSRGRSHTSRLAVAPRLQLSHHRSRHRMNMAYAPTEGLGEAIQRASAICIAYTILPLRVSGSAPSLVSSLRSVVTPSGIGECTSQLLTLSASRPARHTITSVGNRAACMASTLRPCRRNICCRRCRSCCGCSAAAGAAAGGGCRAEFDIRCLPSRIERGDLSTHGVHIGLGSVK